MGTLAHLARDVLTPPRMIQQIRDIHEACRAAGRPAISFEFFPPKTDEGDRTLLEKTIPELKKLNPDYCSVTYGAGGTTRDKTLAIVERIQREHDLTTMMHLTCVNATRAEVASVVADARARGVHNILALRGDPPGGTGEWKPTEGGFTYSAELVTFLREQGGLTIGTAGFPEGHIAQAAGKIADWDFLVTKVRNGADFIVTQLFFENEDFYRFHDYLRGKGVTVPIVPGVLPVLSAKQTIKFVELCGAALPKPFVEKLQSLDGNDDAVIEYGIEYASRQCEALFKFGVQGVHFYTLNKVRSTAGILRNLGLAG